MSMEVDDVVAMEIESPVVSGASSNCTDKHNDQASHVDGAANELLQCATGHFNWLTWRKSQVISPPPFQGDPTVVAPYAPVQCNHLQCSYLQCNINQCCWLDSAFACILSMLHRGDVKLENLADNDLLRNAVMSRDRDAFWIQVCIAVRQSNNGHYKADEDAPWPQDSVNGNAWIALQTAFRNGDIVSSKIRTALCPVCHTTHRLFAGGAYELGLHITDILDAGACHIDRPQKMKCANADCKNDDIACCTALYYIPPVVLIDCQAHAGLFDVLGQRVQASRHKDLFQILPQTINMKIFEYNGVERNEPIYHSIDQLQQMSSDDLAHCFDMKQKRVVPYYLKDIIVHKSHSHFFSIHRQRNTSADGDSLWSVYDDLRGHIRGTCTVRAQTDLSIHAISAFLRTQRLSWYSPRPGPAAQGNDIRCHALVYTNTCESD
jgi:hypothetical protein